MKLAINGWRVHGQRTGIGRYVYNVVRHWDRAAVAGRFEEVVFYSQKPVREADLTLPDNVRERVLGPDWPMLIWENLRFGPTAREDVLFCPSYSRPIATSRRTVVTIFEATLKLHPEYFPREHWYSISTPYLRLYEWSGKHATLVLTATEAARRDIVRAYGIPDEKIRVVPIAPFDTFRPLADDARVREARRRYAGEDEPFFLFVGKITPRRNVPALMDAFASFRQATNLPHRLVVVGKNTTGIDIAGRARGLGLGESFRHVEYVSDADLALLYNAALAFVLPYSYEAVSLTTLEAQATGLPVITMDAPGLREITGNAALYLEAPTIPEIVRALRALAESAGRREELSGAGLEFARQFTWRRTAEETMAVLDEAAQI